MPSHGWQSGRSPLNGRYLASNPRLLFLLSISDAVLRAFEPKNPTPMPNELRRVLVAVGGHLGDAVIATATIDYLRRSLPGTQLGIVLPSWSRCVFEGDPRVQWIHTVDHWKSNRMDANRLRRWRHYRKTRREALRGIRDVGYDAAIDLYGYFPNMALLLSRSGIPTRLGFTSGGLGPLYTCAVPWTDDSRHVAEHQLELAAILARQTAPSSVARYSLFGIRHDLAETERVTAMLREQRLEKHAYIVIHAGTGAVEREWPTANWKDVADRLAKEGHRLVFTGRGGREKSMIDELCAALPGTTPFCDQLDWPSFVEVIRQARLVLTVETAAAHVAAATGTPSVVVWSGITSAHHWGPLGAQTILLSHQVPCLPCFRRQGCEAMSCVRLVSPDDMMNAVHSLLEATVRRGGAVENGLSSSAAR